MQPKVIEFISHLCGSIGKGTAASYELHFTVCTVRKKDSVCAILFLLSVVAELSELKIKAAC